MILYYCIYYTILVILSYFLGKKRGYVKGYKRAKFDLGYSTQKPKDMEYGKKK